MQHLLCQAVNLSAANIEVPIQFHDIMRLPKEQQQEWKITYHEELDALKKRQVYDIVNLPKGHKPIKNRWVFSVKTNGRK